MAATIRVRGGAVVVFETRIFELAADPDGYGLDADEAAAYHLANRCYRDGRLTVPDTAAEREMLARLFTDVSNAEDGPAEDQSLDAEARRSARSSRDSMMGLATKLWYSVEGGEI